MRTLHERAEREVTRLVHAGLGWSELSLRAGDALRAAVPFDYACWHTIDPVTLLFTGATKDTLEEDPRLPYHEYALTDVNQWADLTRQPRPVGILSEATRGRLTDSPRYREMLAPHGVTAEIRAAFMRDRLCWGACGLYRDRGRPDFTATDARLVGSVGQLLADGYRRALLSAAAARGGSDAPGVVVFDADGQLRSVDPTAAALLDGLPGPPGEVSMSVRAVAHRARLGGAEGPARSRIRRPDGRWLVLHGTNLPPDQQAVLVQPAGPADLWPVVAAGYGLTPRERELVVLCARGLSNVEIAGRMHLSPYTVQDYLKVVFAKVGVHSRKALVAKIFLDHYWPPLASGATPGERGGFG